ncbi:MAG: hypothetical protein RLZZ283_191 [Candidatus Parcubacteria bacterium]|jgi:hypothetical protein
MFEKKSMVGEGQEGAKLPQFDQRYFNCFAVLYNRLPDRDDTVRFRVRKFSYAKNIDWGKPDSIEEVSFCVPKGYVIKSSRHVYQERTRLPGLQVQFNPEVAR